MEKQKTQTERPAPKVRFLRKNQVLDRIGVSHTSLYKMISEGKFIKPIHPHGIRTSLWLESDVEQWIADVLADAGKEA